MPTRSASANSKLSKFSSNIFISQPSGVTAAKYARLNGGNVENLLRRNPLLRPTGFINSNFFITFLFPYCKVLIAKPCKCKVKKQVLQGFNSKSHIEIISSYYVLSFSF